MFNSIAANYACKSKISFKKLQIKKRISLFPLRIIAFLSGSSPGSMCERNPMTQEHGLSTPSSARLTQPLRRHGRAVVDGADDLGQVVEVVEALVVAPEHGQVLGPGGDDEERAAGTGLEAAALGLPVRAYGLGLHVDEAETARQGHLLDALLALRDAGRHQHVATLGGRDQAFALGCPDVGLFGAHAVGVAMEEDLVLLGLTQQEHIAEGAIADALDDDAKRALEQARILAAHQEAAGIVAEVALPVLQLPVAHEDVVVVVGLEERRARGRSCG